MLFIQSLDILMMTLAVIASVVLIGSIAYSLYLSKLGNEVQKNY